MNEEFLGVYVTETLEELDKISLILTKLESEKSKKDLPELLRLFHTIKGNSSLMEFADLSETAHILEDVLKSLVSGKLKINNQVIDFVLNGVDKLTDAMALVKEKKNPKIDTQRLIKNARNLKKKKVVGKIKIVEAIPPPKLTQSDSVRVSTESLDVLLKRVGELRAKLAIFQQLEESFDQKVFKRNVDQTEKIINEVQKLVLDERMYPLSAIVSRYPQMVRSLAEAEKKKVTFSLEISDVKLDRSVVDVLHDPLVHLLRNAIDHGIESPSERKKQGKNEYGKITLFAVRKKDSVLIEVSDDGKGIDEQIVLEKALQQGLISKEEIKNMVKDEIIKLVFASGFSTKDKVSKISGRGVGMDIVWNNIQKVGGNVKISTGKGKGTKISISLPLTLAILPVVFVKIGKEHFAVPLLRISKIVAYKGEDFVTIPGRMKKVPVFVAGDLLHINDPNPKQVLIYEFKNDLYGIAIDEVLERRQILIEPPDKRLKNIKGIAASTILGDGSVSLVLDLDSLINNE